VSRSPVLSCAALYFGIVFAVGFVLGALRVSFLVPRIGDDIANRDPVSGVVYLGMLVVFAAMPWLRSRRRP